MIKSKGLVWLPTIQPSMATVPKALLSKHTDYDTIHIRCCHVSVATIRKLSSLGIKGMPAHCTPESRTFCISCVVAISNVANINRASTKNDDPDTFFTHLQSTFWVRSTLLQLGTSLMSLVLYVINPRLFWQS